MAQADVAYSRISTLAWGKTDRIIEYASVNAVAFTYDLNGNLTYDGVQKYIYDAENRLIAVTTLADAPVAAYSDDGAQVVAEYDNGVTKARQRKLPDKT